MTKQEILDMFSDINFAYNNSSKYETLSSMLDELLKEQEPVPPVIQCDTKLMRFWRCGACGVVITEGDKFCRMCRRAVKWE